jgi:hypothetical protein
MERFSAAPRKVTQRSLGRMTMAKTESNAPKQLKVSASKKADTEYQAYTSQVSLIVRTLALAAIAVIWLFASGRPTGTEAASVIFQNVRSSAVLTAALALSLGVLVLDLLQYVWASFAWGTYRWCLEQIFVNDDWDQVLSYRARLGWAGARLFHFVRYLEFYSRGADGNCHAVKWRVRRQRLRKVLEKSNSDHERSLTSALAAPWSPLFISRVSMIFFVSKTVGLMVCYALVGRYLLG